LAKYRKRPVIVEAEQYRPGLEDGIFLPFENEFISKDDPGIEHYKGYNYYPVIKTLEGYHEISPGDYIITGIQGERYPCKPDIFRATYELVEEGPHADR
jgi:hypothetical protein